MRLRHLLLAGAAAAAIAGPASAGDDGMIGEIQITTASFCPVAYVHAAGQMLPIANNQALFALYGDRFGGDGMTTFGLPDMRGRTPVGTDYTAHGPYRIGAMGGVETTTLGPNVISHRHSLVGSSADPSQGSTSNGGLPDKTYAANTNPVYASNALSPGNLTTTVQMQSDILSSVGSGAGFTRLQPSLVLRYCVRTTGYFPSRN